MPQQSSTCLFFVLFLHFDVSISSLSKIAPVYWIQALVITIEAYIYLPKRLDTFWAICSRIKKNQIFFIDL